MHFSMCKRSTALVCCVLCMLTLVAASDDQVLQQAGSAAQQKPSPSSIKQEYQWCIQRPVPMSLPELNQMHECPSVSPVLLLPYLWTPIEVSIKCPSSWYSVYMAQNEPQMSHNIQHQDQAWCWMPESWLNGKTCKLLISPFQRTLVGIKGSKGCEMTSTATVSYLMMGCGAVGLFLFYSAGYLSSSRPFRLGCGTTLFVSGSVILALIFLFRMLPHKRTVAAAFTVAGSTSLAVARWVTGQWLPSMHQLFANRIFGGYVVLSTIVGLIITYLYDDMRNHKVNTVIKVAFRGIGLILVYFATWTFWPVSATALGILITSLIGPDVARGAQAAGAQVQQAVVTTAKILATPFTARKQRRFTGLQTPAKSPSSTGAKHPVHLLAREVEEDRVQPSPLSHAEVDPMQPREYTDLTPVHLKQTPPAPWEVKPKRRVATFEEKMTYAITRKPRSASRKAASTTSPYTDGTARRSMKQEPPEEEQPQQTDDDGISEVVRSGYILNPNSGRLIKIGGDVFNRLVHEDGFKVDVAVGTLVPPDGVVSAPPARGSRGSAGKSRR